MNPSRAGAPRVLLSALRTPGSAAFLAPSIGARVFGLTPDGETNYLVRLFAARNVALTAGLLASDAKSRRLWWQAGIACDALDVAAGLLGLREGKERSSVAVDTGASLTATALGVAGLLADGRSSRRRFR